MSVECNAIIRSVSLDNDCHGALSAWVHVEYGDGATQGFGGYALYLPKSFNHHELLSTAGHFIWRCLEIGGVSEWTKLQGKAIRVRRDKEGLAGDIIAIGHITKNDWFCPREDFKDL